MTKKFEISGALFDKNDGLENIEEIRKVVVEVYSLFNIKFDEKYLNSVKVFVDNSTQNSGHTPLIAPVLNEILIIRLGLTSNSSKGQVIFQFAHELTHALFYSIYGFDKPKALEKEENICTAVSLMVIEDLCPEELAFFLLYVKNLDEPKYRNGFYLYKKTRKDYNTIIDMITDFEEYK